MESFDQGMWNWFQAQRAPRFDQVVLSVSLLGTPVVLAVVTLLAVLFFLWKRKLVTAIMLPAAFGISFLLVGPVQNLVERERPEVAYRPLEKPVASYSFPSDHAWLAAATFLSVALGLAETVSLAKNRVLVLGLGIALALAVGVSRLFVGLCYPSDVIAGWMAGFGLALAVYWIKNQLPLAAKAG